MQFKNYKFMFILTGFFSPRFFLITFTLTSKKDFSIKNLEQSRLNQLFAPILSYPQLWQVRNVYMPKQVGCPLQSHGDY